jgi:hypothetical protein
MAKKRYELDTRVLTVFFLVAMPFVAFGSFLVVNMARGQLQETVGESLEQRALTTKLSLERYIGEQIVHLRVVSVDPEVRQALSVAAAAHEPTADEARRLEQAWASGSDPKLMAPVLESPLARYLREMAQVRSALRLLQIIDAKGRLLASSMRGGRLLHQDTSWFETLARDEGMGRAYVGELYRQPGSSMTLFEVAYPVRAEGRWTGAVRALVDGADLHGVLAPVRIGRTGHAELLRSSDGVVLVSDDSERDFRRRFSGFALVQAAMREKRGFWMIPEVRRTTENKEAFVEPARLVGYAPVDQVPNVQWLVTVEQDVSEAMAPITGITRYLWMHFIGVFGTVILLALYFSFKLETPVIEEELHLHEEHVPAGTRPVAS